MPYRSLRAVSMLLLVLILAAPARAQQKPFTLEQVRGLVRDGIGDETGAKLIVQRGIAFVLTDDVIQSLKSAGASEAFLSALRAAKPPQTPGEGATKPLTQIQVLSLVAGEVPHHHIAQLVHDRGIGFEPTEQVFRELRLAGADEEIISALKIAKVTKPSTVDPAAQARQAQVQQHTARASELLNKLQFTEAESEYRAAIQLDPQNAYLHVSLGYTLGRKGDWDGQIAEEREAIRLNPNYDQAYLNLGVALSQKDDQAGAIAAYREAIRLNPSNDQAHINLGNRLLHKGDRDGARAEYREAIRLSPNNEDAHTSLGSVLLDDKDWDGTIKEYREALRINPNNEDSHLMLGVAFSQKGDQDGAIAQYREAIRLNPRDEQAHINLGNRLSYKKDYDGAFAEYSEAVRLNPKNDVAHYSLGLTYENKGNRQGALQEYRTALDLNSKDPDYQKAYARLNSPGN